MPRLSRLRLNIIYMDTLPGDVVFVILRKLATDDPLSLLRATCVLAPFHRVAAENREIWKEAFLGSHQELLLKTDVQIWPCWRADLADLDAEVETVGGYKNLLTALLIETPKSRNVVEQRQIEAWATVQGQKFRSKKVMVLVRLHGLALLWGSYPQDALADPEGYIDHGFVGVSLQSLHPVDFPKILRTAEYRRRVSNKSGETVSLSVSQGFP